MKKNVMISGEFTINELTKIEIAKTPQPAPKKKSASARIAALKAAGVDVSNYFPMGDDKIVRVDAGVPTQVLDDDPVFARISNGGYISHGKLYRRWVMAQMFRMLRRMEEEKKDFTAVLQRFGYEYSWKMLENELLAQYKMSKHGDTEAFDERNRWFNRGVAFSMAEHYSKLFREMVDGIRTRSCKGRPYKRICGTNVFTDEIETKVFEPLTYAVNSIENVHTPYALYKAVVSFNRLRNRLRHETKMSKFFINAYKGAGAYFTMKNLILFHGARFNGYPSEHKSLSRMQSLADECEGWELLGAMKKLIADSGISIEAKIAEWSK